MRNCTVRLDVDHDVHAVAEHLADVAHPRHVALERVAEAELDGAEAPLDVTERLLGQRLRRLVTQLVLDTIT